MELRMVTTRRYFPTWSCAWSRQGDTSPHGAAHGHDEEKLATKSQPRWTRESLRWPRPVVAGHGRLLVAATESQPVARVMHHAAQLPHQQH
jgi:hypothetical protein